MCPSSPRHLLRRRQPRQNTPGVITEQPSTGLHNLIRPILPNPRKHLKITSATRPPIDRPALNRQYQHNPERADAQHVHQQAPLRAIQPAQLPLPPVPVLDLLLQIPPKQNPVLPRLSRLHRRRQLHLRHLV